jgi:hypothetical protein
VQGTTVKRHSKIIPLPKLCDSVCTRPCGTTTPTIPPFARRNVRRNCNCQNSSTFCLATGDTTIHSNLHTATLVSARGNCRAVRLPGDQSHFGISRRYVAFVQCLDAHIENASAANCIYSVVARSDAGIFDARNLLTDQCIIARPTVTQPCRGTAMTHCPLFIFSLRAIYCRVVSCCNETIELDWVPM